MLRKRTIIIFAIITATAYFAVHAFTAQWVMVFLSLFFLFVGSVLLHSYLEFSQKIEGKKWNSFPFVSVLVPNYNGEKHVGKCLSSIKKLEYPKNKIEIIVVDDASTDKSSAIIKKFSGIKLIQQKKNMGKARALNTALKQAKGEFVACIDSDTYPDSDSLKKMIEMFDSKEIGAVTGLIRVHNPHNLLMRIQQLEYLIGFGFYQSMLSLINAAFVTPGPMSVYRKKCLVDAGGYDENNITEDMGVALQLQYNGCRIKARHDASIYTEVPENWKAWLRQRLRWYRGKIFNTIKFREMFLNPKFGDLGFFSLPFSFFLEISSVFALFVFAILAMQNAEIMLRSILAWASISTFPAIKILPPLVNSSVLFTYSTLIFIFLFTLTASHKIAGEKLGLKKILPIISIMAFYSMAVAGVWLYSMFKEINKSEYKW